MYKAEVTTYGLINYMQELTHIYILSSYPSAIKLWNKLSSSVVQADSLETFKQQLTNI